ncbi:MAG: sulfotransferase [Gemmatimonadetes bacterium]|nr:MAG: sulfotransferase [Gemmatimonadota bacterium]
MKYLFLTGMLRSGTTLLDKLLCNHPQLSVLSQPFPYLFIQAKRDFLRQECGEDEYYALTHGFLETRYTLDQFHRFLQDYTLTPHQVERLFIAMEGYTGQNTRLDRLSDFIDHLTKGVWLHIFKAFLYFFRQKGKSVEYVGSKEVLCEEFLPFLLDQGFKCLIVIRDPRDVLTSMGYGNGKTYIGSARPTLFNLRNWRKSVAYALHLQHHPNFVWVRYEDIVAKPVEMLNRLANWLEIASFPSDLFQAGILDQNGEPWMGNSSFQPVAGVTPQSVGKYQALLPPDLIQYTEYTCFPEMLALEYPLMYPDIKTSYDPRSFTEPVSIQRAHFSLNYSTDPVHVAQEQTRIQLLCNESELLPHHTAYFLFEDVFYTLKSVL